jgi:hypothetical protein
MATIPVRKQRAGDIVSQFKSAQSRLVLQTADLPLGTLADMVESKTIDLQPSFQRRERWHLDKQSALIESFILNVPVPPIYLSEDDYGRYTAIDGKQRLRTICDFIKGRFRLQHLSGFQQIEGLQFDDLPTEIKNALQIRPFLRVVTLLKQSDPELKYEVFTRLNRGGEALNAQEIRNVAFRGPLNDLIYDLAKLDFLRARLKIRDNNSSPFKEMQDAEFVLRFLALHEVGGKFSGSLLKSMDNFMIKYRIAQATRLREFERLFKTALTRCEEIWSEKAFKRPDGDGWRDQTLAGMYDAQMLATSSLTNQQFASAKRRHAVAVRATRKLFDDAVFEESVRLGTNTPSRIEYRVERIRKMLLSL